MTDVAAAGAVDDALALHSGSGRIGLVATVGASAMAALRLRQASAIAIGHPVAGAASSR